MTAPGKPAPETLRWDMTHGAARAVVVMSVLMLVIGGANLFFTTSEVSHLRAAVLASCAFAADVGTAPVAANPATGKPSRLGISIVADSRKQWHQLGCPGQLPPPPPSFVWWARYYHLPDK